MTASLSLENIPSNTYKPNSPWEATVLEHRRLTAPDSPNEVCHIVLDRAGSDLNYIDGQSIGVLPPGEDANGKPHKLRLYSIASPADGDNWDGKTVSVCIKRALSEGFPPGVCSSYLCDAQVGDKIKITGPVGKSFLLPNVPDANLIMVATGTGIAPFRAFLKTRYTLRTEENGQNWLFFGAQTRKDFLYEDEYPAYQKHDTFNLVTAFSREEQNKSGGRMYVQHRIEEHAETVFNLLRDTKTYFFMCGLRGMEDGILEGLRNAAHQVGVNWDVFFQELKAQNRWHVEVY